MGAMMSFDFSLEKVCSHEVVLETSTAETEARDVFQFPKPPVNSNVSVHVDGFKVPPGGLFSKAVLTFKFPEPYRIVAGVNDLLSIRVGTGPTQLIQLIPGNAVRASALAAYLQQKLPSLSVGVMNKRVSLSSVDPVNGTAFGLVDPRWTDKSGSLLTTARVVAACSTFGLSPGRQAYGKKLFPGWAVEKVPGDPDETRRQLRFEFGLFNHDPIVQLSYVTNLQNCRRCHGAQIEFDYSLKNGTYEIVTDADLLAQEFDKFLFTRLGSHWKWPWMGSGLMDRIGGKGSTGAPPINSLINVYVSRAFLVYQNIKFQQDSEFPSQSVSDAEFPFGLGGIEVGAARNDPTIVFVTTTIVSRSRDPIELKRVIGNPSPLFLPGSSSPFLLRG